MWIHRPRLRVYGDLLRIFRGNVFSFADGQSMYPRACIGQRMAKGVDTHLHGLFANM